MSVAMDVPVSAAEYLALEREALTKSEFVNGRIYAMAGASATHNEIAGNLFGLLWSALRSGPCRPYGSDQRIGVPATGIYTYPDISIVCQPKLSDPKDADTLINPTALFEVLSPSTEAYDRGAKFAHYRRLPSLREYWLVSADRRRIERFRKHGEVWELEEFEGVEAIIPLSVAAGVSIPLSAVYEGVSVPEVPDK